MSTDTANRQPLPARLRLPGAILALAALAMAGFTTAAQANLVSNGSFETFSNTASGCTNSSQQVVNSGTSSNLTGWTTGPGTAASPPSPPNTSYTFVLSTSNYSSFQPLAADNSGNCSAIGLQSTITASGDGGNFVASDPKYENGAYTLAQTITGLLIGSTYNVTFDMGAGQQTTFSGATTDWWTVGLTNTAGSGTSQTTPTITLPSGGFSGWVGETMQFVAGATSQVLWFMGGSTAASGQPPFVLLDGVNLTLTNSQVPVPEPPAYAMLMAGLLGLLGVRRLYRRKS